MKIIATTALLVCAATMALPAQSAQAAKVADPGFCGVRVQGPTPITGGGTFYYWAYTVRNKCGYGLNLLVHLPGNGRDTSCNYVLPGGYQTYTYPADDSNWTIRAC
ncbi:hypothetical protein [Nonomuraea sp. NPDC049141]|uniref:hypothetical protein n=1 Tax=unclassified Nonomuraea TaxID=2593643 RepID=UPI0033C00B34